MSEPMRSILAILLLLGFAQPTVAQSTRITVIDGAALRWDERFPEVVDPDGFGIRFRGQLVEQAVQLPPAPTNLRDARRITAIVNVEPINGTGENAGRPADRWTRLGNVTVLVPIEGGPPVETELVRFVTGYGAGGTYEQDVTPLAPLLHGETVIRAFINTFSPEPAWRVSVSLQFDAQGVGQRRPVYAQPVFHGMHVTTNMNTLTTAVVIPENVDRPRLCVISTGHSTDGLGAHEFESATHVLSIDGQTVAMWRPWSERGGQLRPGNAWAGRRTIDGRTLWASDYDRAGWHPGVVVEPMIIPLPELTPGRHVVQLQVQGIRPKGVLAESGENAHGYWVVTGVVVADEHWPDT